MISKLLFCASIKPNYSVYYWRKNEIDLGFATIEQYEQWKADNLAARLAAKANNELSKKSSSKLSDALNWLVFFSPWQPVYSKKEDKTFWFKMNFITLTLPTMQVHSDDYIKSRMLAPFLLWMKRSHNALHYVWKAETQDNGNIHFHITTNTFMHWRSIRKKWNTILANHGYCKVFQDGSNDKGDAATQIKAVKNHNQLLSYLKKYYTKNDSMKKNITMKTTLASIPPEYFEVCMMSVCNGFVSEYKRPIEGRQWSVSNSLASLKVTHISPIHEDDEVMKHHNRHVIERTFSHQYATIGIHKSRDRLNWHPSIREKFLEIKKVIQGNRGKKNTIIIDSIN